MDSRFLKFWGQFLLQAAEGRKRFEDLNRWMSSGFSGPDDLTELFKDAYGLKQGCSSADEQSEAWKRSAAKFQEALSDYLSLDRDSDFIGGRSCRRAH